MKIHLLVYVFVLVKIVSNCYLVQFYSAWSRFQCVGMAMLIMSERERQNPKASHSLSSFRRGFFYSTTGEKIGPSCFCWVFSSNFCIVVFSSF